jgi:hypothetical protein
MEKLPKDLREVSEKHETEVKFGQSPIEVEWVNYRHCYDESAKPPYRKVVRKVNFIEK